MISAVFFEVDFGLYCPKLNLDFKFFTLISYVPCNLPDIKFKSRLAQDFRVLGWKVLLGNLEELF